MYLSRFCFNGNNETHRFIASPQRIHASVENCFKDKDGNLPDRVTGNRSLWRMDELGGKQYLLLLSPTVPDFAPFMSFGNEGEAGESRDYEPFLSRLSAGQHWQFRLRGNAVHSKAAGMGKRGKVFAHATVGHKKGWLLKKSASCGFRLDENYFDVIETNHQSFKRGHYDAKPVALGITLFDGELEITDEEVFRNVLTQGIGRAKAYGCGLLTLAKR